MQVVNVLLFVTLERFLWMAFYAAAGSRRGGWAGGTSPIATAVCAAVGVNFAIRRRYSDHRRWMWRCFLLLCSAVVLRLLGGLAVVTGVTAPWFDPLATWMSWLHAADGL